MLISEAALYVVTGFSVPWGAYLLYTSCYKHWKDLRTANQTYIDITTKFESVDNFTQRVRKGDGEATEAMQKVIDLVGRLSPRDVDNNPRLIELRGAIINAEM